MEARPTLTRRQKPLLGALWLAVGPPLIMGAYLYVTRMWIDTRSADVTALVVACVAGLPGLFLLRLRRLPAILLSLLYLVLMAGALIPFTLAFVCSAFGDCL